jgi:asparagine synthase (glutamine-hydrolysing)
MNELLADASCFPVYQLSRFARKKVTVILSGDGGDELLAGYDTYRAGDITPYLNKLPRNLKIIIRSIVRHLPSNNRRYDWRMVANRILDASDEGQGRDHSSFRLIFNTFMKKRLYDPDFYKVAAQLDPIGEYANLMKEVPSGRSYLTARQHADMLFHLPSILAKVDRMSMANGLEVRVPLLSREMVEFCMNLPDNAKIHGGKGKRILRQAVRDRIPPGGLRRPKAGFLPPVDKWFRDQGPMNNIFGDYLNTAKFSLGWLKWDEVEKLWEEHKNGQKEVGYMLLGVLQFINWGLKFTKGSVRG